LPAFFLLRFSYAPHCCHLICTAQGAQADRLLAHFECVGKAGGDESDDATSGAGSEAASVEDAEDARGSFGGDDGDDDDAAAVDVDNGAQPKADDESGEDRPSAGAKAVMKKKQGGQMQFFELRVRCGRGSGRGNGRRGVEGKKMD